MAQPVLLHAGQSPNLIDSYSYISSGAATGDLNVLYKPRLAAEGGNPSGPEAVTLQGSEAYISIDFGRPRLIRSILIQAENSDEYVVEASLSGNWVTLWKVPTIYAGIGINPMGLRVRTTVLPEAVQTRYLRLRGVRSNFSTDARFAVSRLQAYSTVPSKWPPALSYKDEATYRPHLLFIDRGDINSIKLFLAFATVALMTWALLARRISESARERKTRRALMVVMIILSCYAWPNFLNFHFRTSIHSHDMFHYYMGSKYSGELGYTLLYDCAAIADFQDGMGEEVLSRRIRNLATNEQRYVPQLLQNPEICLSEFTQERWEEFKRDVRWFRNFSTPFSWSSLFNDYGFNATPVWTVMGKTISSIIPLSKGFLVLITGLDYVILLASALLIYRTFGLEATVAAVSFFCLYVYSSFGYNGGSFLRFDWFLWLTIGVCASYTKRNMLAGFAFTYSALLRIFPGFVFLGIGIKMLVEMLKARSISPILDHRSMLAGTAITVAILIPLSFIVPDRAGIWGEFQKNMQKHVANASQNTAGLKRVLEDVTYYSKTDKHPYMGYITMENKSSFKAIAERNQKAVWILAVLAMTVLLFYSIRREDLWVSAILSLGLVPFFVNLSDYYFVYLSVFALLWVRRPAAAYALGMMQLIAWLVTVLLNDLGTRYVLTSVLFLSYIFIVFIMFALDRRASLRATANRPAPEVKAD